MPRFPELPDDEYASIYLEDTDRPLPRKIHQNTRYAYHKTIARRQGKQPILQGLASLARALRQETS